MRKFLLDTDVSVNYLRGSVDVIRKVQTAIPDVCISEITVAELKFGAAKSKRPEFNQWRVETFSAKFEILPISEALDIFASEKARLEKIGSRLDNFDLLIGATAIRFGLVLVTNNIKHFKRMHNLTLENWIP